MFQALGIHISARTALFLLAAQVGASVLLFNVGWVPRIQALAGQALPDSHFGINPTALYATLEAMGAAGRSLYGSYLLVADSLYAALSAAAFAAVLLAAADRAQRFAGMLRALSPLPLLLLPLDWLENSLMLVVLARFPHPIMAAGVVTGVINLKLLLVNASAGLVLISLLVLLISALRRRPTDTSPGIH